MYLQEIVISPDIFEKISKAYSEDYDIDIDLKSYKENLELKKIIFDKDENEESEIFRLIKNVIDNSSNFGKQKIDSVLKIFLKEGRLNYKSISEIKKFCSDDVSNKIISLGILSDSKIVNSEKYELSLLKLNNPELSELEILNFEEFIKPTSNSKVFCNNKTLEIKRGDKFHFEEHFRPYLSETTKLSVTDRFLRKRKGGYMNLIRLLKICTKLESLKIYTILKTGSDKYKPDIEIDDIEKEITGLANSLKIEFFSSGDHQRILETDDFKITLEPGFDFVNENYIAKNHNVVINFERINH